MQRARFAWYSQRIGCIGCAFCILLSVATTGSAQAPQLPPDLTDDILSPSDRPPPLPQHPERTQRDPSKSAPQQPKPAEPKPPKKSGPLVIEERLPFPGKPDRNLPALDETAEAEAEMEEEAEEETEEESEEAGGLFKRLPHSLRDGGITAAYVYTGESYYLARGGSSNRRVGNYRHNLDVVVDVNTSKMGWWENGRFFLYGNTVQGRPLSQDFVGDAQLFSNIDSTVSDTERSYYAAIGSYYYEHLFADDFLRAKIGKMDANVDFGLSDIGSDFVNSSFAMNPNIPLPTFPSQALGLATFFQLTDQLNIGSGVYDGTLADGPQGTQFGFNTLGHNGALSLLQLEYRSQTGPGGEHPGTVRLGGWHHSDKTVWTDFGDGTSTFNQNYGLWCNVDQMIWKESYGTDDDQGLSLFFLLGLAPGDRNSLSESYGYGLSYKGLIDCRDDDVIGAGVATVVFSREFRDFTFLDSGDVVRHSETAFEMFYKYKWSDYCTIQPDLQFIARPGGQFKDALLPGVRFQLVF